MPDRRRQASGGGSSRSFAVKGVFRYVRLRGHGATRRRDVWFEERILRISARDERDAVRKGHRAFGVTAFAAEGSVHPQAESLAVTYLGIGRVLAFGEVGMREEEDELWWEFLDERPKVQERPKRRKP